MSQLEVSSPAPPVPQVLEIVNDSVVRRLSESQQENVVPAEPPYQQQPKPVPEQKPQGQVAAATIASTQTPELARPAAALQNRQQPA